MAIGFVQCLGNRSGQTTTGVQAVTATAGNLLVCGVSGWQSPVTTVSSVADNNGNTWQKAFGITGGNNRVAEIWYAMNCNSGATTVTVTWSLTTYNLISVAEFSGVATSSAFDVGAGTETVAGTTLPSGNTATATANDLIIGVESDANGSVVLSAGTSFTMGYNSSPSPTQGALEYILDSGSSGVQSASFTAASAITAAVAVATFKKAVVAGSSTPTEGHRNRRPRMFRMIIKRRTVYDMSMAVSPWADAATRFGVTDHIFPPPAKPLTQAVNRASVI